MLLAAVVVVLTGSSTTALAAVSSTSVERTYVDRQGDASGALDITAVTLSSDGNSLSMKVTTLAKTLNSDQAIGAELDTDSNAATGNSEGFDYYWSVIGGGNGSIRFYRWTGSWSQVTFKSYQGSQIDFGVTVSFSLAGDRHPQKLPFRHLHEREPCSAEARRCCT